MDVFKFGLGHWKKYLPAAIFFQLISFAALTADLMIPMISEMFIDYVICRNVPDGRGIFSFLLSGKYGEVQSFALFRSLAVLLMLFLSLRILFVYGKNLWNEKLGLRLETDLRMKTFDKLLTLDSALIGEYNTGELLTILNGDTIMFKDLFSRILPLILDSVFVLIASAVFLAGIHPWLLAFSVCFMPVFAAALMKFRKLAWEAYGVTRGNISAMNLTVQENIEAVRLVRSFTNERLEEEKFDQTNEKLKNSCIRLAKLLAGFEVVFSSIKQLAYVGSVAVGAVLVIRGDIRVGYLAACTSYVLKIMDYITQINSALFQMQQQLVSGQKMMQFMEKPSRILDGEKKVEEKRADIELCHAGLTLNGEPILKDISVSIPYGKKLGIVGETGCGKSVLMESLVRIFDVTEGSILLNGRNVKEYELSSLRECFSYVFQDVFLFSNTIDSNIAYGKPEVGEEQVVTAARHAQAHGFIQGLSDGYDTIVGERGFGISGGQKQRVSIARALLKNAPVLVFDDSTSALDMNTEKNLLSDINRYYPGKTIIISAHRLSSVENCDEILYMQEGEIKERGTFEELMALKGHFAKVYQIQKARDREFIDKEGEEDL
ncbi:MAG: ABC transporter ATP-binding protein/permease [Lachnospiraceae bacterium]|nr:ABC transporter ATP-binding protein/permease [Lachnospiraceae bacterium]